MCAADTQTYSHTSCLVSPRETHMPPSMPPSIPPRTTSMPPSISPRIHVPPRTTSMPSRLHSIPPKAPSTTPRIHPRATRIPRATERELVLAKQETHTISDEAAQSSILNASLKLTCSLIKGSGMERRNRRQPQLVCEYVCISAAHIPSLATFLFAKVAILWLRAGWPAALPGRECLRRCSCQRNVDVAERPPNPYVHHRHHPA